MKIDKGSFINDFIDKNLRQYSIPVYQRNYEWSAEQCEKLFEDILQAHELDRYHFTGSVVYSLLETKNKIDYYVIIDGQQRLTTIYILIKALIDVAETDGEKEVLTSVLFNEDKFKKYNIDESSKLKLKPIKSDNIQLLYLMENKVDKMDKSSGIYKNYDLFCRLIRDVLSKDEFLAPCVKFGYGIRILNQDLFEMIVSFIISANNNIKRIKNSLNYLSKSFGTKF